MRGTHHAAAMASLVLAGVAGTGCPKPPACGNGEIEEKEACDDGNTASGDGCSAGCVVEKVAPFCGDGIADAAIGEACDGADLAGEDCVTLGQGFDGGTLACATGCSYDTAACTTPPAPFCGDGTIGAGEDCEPGPPPDVGGATCASLSFAGGSLGCIEAGEAGECTFDTNDCFECGNGVLDPGEPCDGSDFGAADCFSAGFTAGALACTGACALDTSACTLCGDGLADTGEACDGSDLAGSTCLSAGFEGGVLACQDDCTLDVSACALCGDLVRTAPEDCDGIDLGGQACTTIGQGWAGGLLACTAACTYDVAGCIAPPSCGDGAIDGGSGEDCDGASLGTATCMTLGHATGTLVCTGGCVFDTSGCSTCGNDVIEAAELCDGLDLAGETCTTQGHEAGTLSCASDCASLDDAACSDCGDGLAEPPESCDGSDLGTSSCMSLGHGAGMLGCTSACTTDESACYTCGNGVRETAELCDGASLAGETCASQGWVGGSLACAPGCQSFDESACTDCGDGIVDAGESCDGANLAGEDCASQGYTAGTLACTSSCSFDTFGCITASMECAAWCGCQTTFCATDPSNPFTSPTAYADCLSACGGLAAADLSCRTAHCGYAMSDPGGHCPHSAGVSLCM